MFVKKQYTAVPLTVNRNRLLLLILANLVLIVPTTAPDCDREFYETDCTDGEDNDCDGAIDCADADCCNLDGCPQCEEICGNEADDDGDGLIDCEDPDCGTFSGCSERFACGDLVDNDFDGAIDCDDVDCRESPLCPGGATRTDSEGFVTAATTTIKERPESDDITTDEFGCVTTPCGNFCGLEPNTQYTVSCGWNSVVQYPEEMQAGSGSCVNTHGDFAGVFAQLTANYLFANGDVTPTLQNQTFNRPDFTTSVMESTTLNENLSSWTCEMLFFHDEIDFNGEEITIWPVAKVEALDGTKILFPYLESKIDFVNAPDRLIHTIVTETQNGDAAIAAKAMPDPAGVASDLRLQITAMNRSPVSLTNASITGTLSSNFVFDASKSDDEVLHDGSPMGGSFTINVGAMESLDAERFRIVGQSAVAGTVSLTASIDADEVDPDMSNNTVMLDTAVGNFADASISIASNQAPVVTNGDFMLNVTIVNDGPLDTTGATYTITLPATTEFVSSTAGTHDGSPTGGTIDGTVNMEVFESQIIEVTARPVVQGNTLVSVSGSVSVSAPMIDPDPVDNTVTIDIEQVDDTSGTPTPVVTTLAIDQHVGTALNTSIPNGLPSDVIASITKPYLASDGQTLALRVNLVGGDDAVLRGTIANGIQAVARENASIITDSGQTLGAIDDKIGINENGDYSFGARIVETNQKAAFKGIGDNLSGGSGILTVIAAQSDSLPSPINTLGLLINQVLIDNNGSIFVAADTTGLNQQDFFVFSTDDDGQTFNVILQEGVTIPTNQAGGGVEKWDNVDNESGFNRNGLSITGDGLTVGIRGDLEGSALTDDIFALNNAIVFQEGEDFGGVIPMSDGGFAAFIDVRSGIPYVRGTAQGGTSIVVRNGQLVGVEGAELFSGAGENWQNSFLFVIDDGANGYAIGGRSDQSPGGLIVHYPDGSAPRVVYRAGESIDMDGNGLFDDNTTLDTPTSDNAVILQDFQLVLRANVTDRAGNFIDGALFSLNIALLTGACCLPDESCINNQTFDECALQGGTYLGDFSLCLPGACNPDPLICTTVPGDVNGDGAVNGSDIAPYVNCVTDAEATDCDCADMTFDDVVDSDDTALFVSSLLELDTKHTTAFGPIVGTISTDTGDHAVMIDGEICFAAGAPDSDGVRALTITELLIATSSVPTSGGETGGMSFLNKLGTGSGTWNLQTGEFSLAGDFDGGYQLADEALPDPPLADETADTEERGRELWGAFLTASAALGQGAQSVELDGELTLDVIESITEKVTQVRAPIEALTVPVPVVNLPSCPEKHKCMKRVICIQPVFIRTDAGTNPTGSSFATYRAAADALWARCCVEFDWQDPVFVDETDFQVIENSETPAGLAERINLRAQVDPRGNNNCIEVFFVDQMTKANGDGHASGDGVTSSSGMKHAKVIVSDAAIDDCDPEATLVLAHEFGHVMNLDHPSRCIMTPGGSSPACPTNNPDKVRLEQCKSLRNPLLKPKTPAEDCCKQPSACDQ